MPPAETSILLDFGTRCHIFISKSLLKYLPAHFDIINRTLDIFRNRDFLVVANYHGYTEKGPLKNNLTYIIYIVEISKTPVDLSLGTSYIFTYPGFHPIGIIRVALHNVTGTVDVEI